LNRTSASDVIPYYGPNPRPRDVLADFLLGVNRNCLIIDRLAESGGYSAPQLILRTSRAPSLWPNCTVCIASDNAGVEHAFRDPDSLALGSA
jgi:hypothetical protein